jgi:dephospho-CoA kinase
MLKVGVTGGIGSGKSLVCNLIRSMGYPVFHADAEAKILTNIHPNIVENVKKLLGNDVYVKGELDRKRVAEMVFKNPILLEQLNEIIHPVVTNHFNSWCLSKSNFTLVFMEAAILFESGTFRQLDSIIAVYAPKYIRIKRVMKRDGVREHDVKARMANQIGDEELVNRSNFVIRNNENELLVPQVNSIIEQLLDSVKD